WWTRAGDNYDRATAMLPALFESRMEELGLDFSVVFPTVLGVLVEPDEELRRALCRGMNVMRAELFAPHAAVPTCAAVIAAQPPEEAIEELEYAVLTLGLKVVTLPSYVTRPIGSLASNASETMDVPMFDGNGTWLDNMVIDSPYDYDPLWAR